MDALTAKIDLIAADIEVQELDKTDTFVWLANKGLPANVLLTLEPIWTTTRILGGRVISLGKIIISKIIEFIQAHPGSIIGITFGAAIGVLTYMIPFIGPLLAPAVAAISIVGLGAFGANNDDEGISPLETMKDIAAGFFATIAAILNALFSELLEA